MYQGKSIQVTRLDGDVAELKFDRQNESVNKFDAATIAELKEAGSLLTADTSLKGLIVTSGKDVFIVGADITEFGKSFQLPEEEIAKWAIETNKVFSAIEDLPFPSVTAINGIALGGGFEMALTTDYRVISAKASIGFPEVKLGIIPGFAGTVRFPRLVGADNAIEWIAGGEAAKPDAALKIRAVDAVVPPEKTREAALKLLALAQSGAFDWKARRAQKTGKLKLGPIEAAMVFETAKGFIAGKAGKHFPAPVAAVTSIQKGAGKTRDDAIAIESATFAKLAKTQAADSLIGLFLNDQLLKKKGKAYSKIARPVKQGAVLGAGIMGGGIAYQSASRGTPVIMKDIADKALDLGMNEANKLLSAQVGRKKMTPEKAGAVLSTIRPTLNYGDFGAVDVVVEAVVENPKVKKAVLADVENIVRADTVIASNTSSISIDLLAADLKRPENFLGMHFFNPVHKMPLVEVIKGAKTSPEAVATIVAYASAMGKTPIVVNNCPGFLVNRILFPYFGGWSLLLRDGADYQKMDKAAESFGWPMGPSYLQDVVGIDTSHHVGDVLAEGYPDRMGREFKTALDVMYEAKRYGQKNGVGFYKYETDPKGKPKKVVVADTYELIAQVQLNGTKDFGDEEIMERLMIPMIIETARCLEEKIVDTANEADMGLIMGVGFPPHLGGALKYADSIGLANLVEKCAKYASLGKLYEPTATMKAMAVAGQLYYPK
ncbi:fatty acid oxidation complex subunit alpha FadB [uncultured Nevskia sp.]|uniref:fatty acid oxidation complex subunit alpha FadB n=1 Tax=uncultured Nevskia sp. TaxID=228950 RepID=UPI0025EFE990|nr:fatty acid oxidation complex subunit alpha FadB [uncultured Nevskia sp.]